MGDAVNRTIRFLHDGDIVEIDGAAPTRTVLQWLREDRMRCGTKEGCAEGDCGACTVMVTDERGARARNACILFLPQLMGKSVRTVEGIAAPDGTLHPAQAALVEHHGAQCGFCTPGFVVSMATDHLNGSTDHDTTLAGNLCRCTGYAPIVRAAKSIEGAPVPPHLKEAPPRLAPPSSGNALEAGPGPSRAGDGLGALPQSSDDLAAWALENPEGTIIAGATDVGRWVTKDFADLGPVAFLHGNTPNL